MHLYIKKNYPDAKMPERANESDVGLDVFVHSYKIIGEKLDETTYKSIQYIEYDTGLSVQPQEEFISNRETKNYFTYLAPRSSISKYNLFLLNGFGVIDRSYTGPLKLRMGYRVQESDRVYYNGGNWLFSGIQIDENKIYKVGDKCGQLIVTEQPLVKLIEVNELMETDRGNGGFGSSGGNSAG